MANGEGSRGGKIVGHTKSGLPIYQSNHHINVKALAIAGVGVGISLGSGAIGKFARKMTGKKSFGTVAKYASIFAGESTAAGASDEFIEDLHTEHEQGIKNFTAGSLGILGAFAGGMKIKPFKKRRF